MSARNVILRISYFIMLISDGFLANAQQDTTSQIRMDSVYSKPDVHASFKGGSKAWAAYLENEMVYPSEARRMEIVGTVVVSFIVDENGRVQNVEAINGPMELRQAAVNMIRKSPRWVPAQMHGYNVKSYMHQPIDYSLR